MNQFEMTAEPRVDQGKGASRRLRREGKVPAVLYGAGKEAVAIQLDHNSLRRQLQSEAFYSHILHLSLNGTDEQVVLKDVQRHPVRPQILHIDLLRIDENEELEMRVPVHTINEEQCIGVKTKGGLINHQMNEVEVLCLPKNLPEYIEVDVAELDVGDTVHLEDLQLPEGVRSAVIAHGGDGSLPVVSVQMPKIVIEEEEEEVAEGLEGEVEGEVEGEEGAEADATPEREEGEGKES